MPPVGIGAVLYGRYVKRLSKQAQASLGEAVGVASERLSAVRTVKLCNAEEREQQRFNEKVDDIYTVSRDMCARPPARPAAASPVLSAAAASSHTQARLR